MREKHKEQERDKQRRKDKERRDKYGKRKEMGRRDGKKSRIESRGHTIPPEDADAGGMAWPGLLRECM